MKAKNFFMAAIIIMSATVTGCNNNKKQEAPEGVKMGNVTVISKTNEAGDSIYKIVTAEGYETPIEYTKIIDHKDFLEGHADNNVSLMNLNGGEFACCDSFSVNQVYPLHSDETTPKFFKLYLGNNRIARNYTTYQSMSQISGTKEEIYPLSNGWIIFKMDGKYGLAKGDSEEALLDNVCSQIFVVTVKDKTYYLVKTENYTGYIDETGKSIKPLTHLSLKVAKTTSKWLWSEANGCVGGLEKDKL